MSFFNIDNTKRHDFNSDDITESKRYYALGVFCIYSIFALTLFDYVILLTRSLESFEAFRITLFVATLLFAFFFFRMIRKTGFPLKMFGITLRHAKLSVIESVFFSILVCLFILLLKWLLITYDDTFSHLGLFSAVPDIKVHRSEYLSFIIFAFLYIIFVPLQSFLLHSVFQSSLMNFLPEGENIVIPIILTSFAFGSIHTDFNLIFAILVMLITLFWATLYARHRTIVGVTVSHIIIGIFALPIMHIIGLTGLLSKQIFN